DKSWILAERAAPNEAERARIHQIRLDADQRKTDFEIAEKKRKADEEAADIQRAKNQAAADLHAAEEAANRQNGGLKAGGPETIQWDELQKNPLVAGTLTQIDCLNGPMKLTVKKTGGGSAVLWMGDPKALMEKQAYPGGGKKPALAVSVRQNAKADAKLGPAGEILSIEFR